MNKGRQKSVIKLQGEKSKSQDWENGEPCTAVQLGMDKWRETVRLQRTRCHLDCRDKQWQGPDSVWLGQCPDRARSSKDSPRDCRQAGLKGRGKSKRKSFVTPGIGNKHWRVFGEIVFKSLKVSLIISEKKLNCAHSKCSDY